MYGSYHIQQCYLASLKNLVILEMEARGLYVLVPPKVRYYMRPN